GRALSIVNAPRCRTGERAGGGPLANLTVRTRPAIRRPGKLAERPVTQPSRPRRSRLSERVQQSNAASAAEILSLMSGPSNEAIGGPGARLRTVTRLVTENSAVEVGAEQGARRHDPGLELGRSRLKIVLAY